MNMGMLWYDSNPQTDLPSKLSRAVSYYVEKYGKKPNLCFIHPSMLADEKTRQLLPALGVELKPNRLVLPHHFWIGVRDAVLNSPREDGQ